MRLVRQPYRDSGAAEMTRAWLVAPMMGLAILSSCGDDKGAAGNPATGTPVEVRSQSGFSLEQAREFDPFTLYWLGDSFAGLPLTGVDFFDASGGDPNFPPPIKTAMLIYGDCEVDDPDGAGPEGGSCGLPLQIQISPVCQLYPGLYFASYSGGPDWDVPAGLTREELAPFTVRGAPARGVDGGLEIYTSDVAIKIYYDGSGDHEDVVEVEEQEDGGIRETQPPQIREALREVAAALEPLNREPLDGADFPSADEKALRGEAACAFDE